MTTRQDHVDMLQRRRTRLQGMVDDWRGKEGGESWARAEISAINFAFRCIKTVHPGLEIEAGEMENVA